MKELIMFNELTKEKKNRSIVLAISLITIIIMSLAYISNYGLAHMWLFLFGVPIVMSLLLLFVNLSSAKYYEESRLFIVLTIIYFLAYSCFMLFLPDAMIATGSEPEYMFFKLIYQVDANTISSTLSNVKYRFIEPWNTLANLSTECMYYFFIHSFIQIIINTIYRIRRKNS